MILLKLTSTNCNDIGRNTCNQTNKKMKTYSSCVFDCYNKYYLHDETECK